MKKKTHEEYVEELAIKNPNIEVIDRYVDAKTKIKHRCKNDGYEWYKNPNGILNGCGCPQCAGNKKKTHDEYVEDVALINLNIEVIGCYVNAVTPILHKCLIDGYEWYAKPNNILSGNGCPKCYGNMQKTHQEYIKEVYIIDPSIEVIETYKNAHTQILHRCNKHNIEWKASPTSILQGCGCYKCGNEKIRLKNGKPHEKYVNDLKKLNPNIVVLDTYINSHTPILHKCLIDGYKWKAQPSNILLGKKCPKCSKHIRYKTQKEYIEEVFAINPNIEVVGNYINAKTPIEHLYKKHNIIWETTPSSILSGCGCIECLKNKIKEKLQKTHEQYIEEVRNINPDIKVIGNYIGANISILHKCMIDGNVWYAKPANILSGCGCPMCNESSGERQVRQWLEKHNISYKFQERYDDCRDKNTLPFDFYLPDYNLIVEYDHKQHFEPIEHFGGVKAFNRTVKHDNIKNKYCEDNGISLLRIPYYKNVEEELNNFLFI